jgi:serine/threonine-protein kinase
MEILRKHTDVVPPRPENLNRLIPRWLGDVVMKAVAKFPRERFPDAAAMAAALRRTSPPPPPPPPPRRAGGEDRPSAGRTGTGRKVLIGALSVIGVTLTAVGVYAFIKNVVIKPPKTVTPTAATATTAATTTATPEEKPRLIAAPNLAGLTVDAARAALKGFTVRVAPNDTATTTGTVSAQDPTVGTELNPENGEWVFSLTKAAWDEKIWGTRRVVISEGPFGKVYGTEGYVKDTVHHDAEFKATWAAKGGGK